MAENFRTPREPCSEERPVCRIARGLSGPRAVAVSHQPLPRQHPLDDIRMRTRLCGRILQNACHQGHLRCRRNRHDQHSDQRKPGGNPAYHWQTVAHCPSLRIAQQRPPQASRGMVASLYILPPCFAFPLVSAPSFKEAGWGRYRSIIPCGPTTALLSLSLRFQLPVMGGQRHAGNEAAHCDHPAGPYRISRRSSPRCAWPASELRQASAA